MNSRIRSGLAAAALALAAVAGPGRALADIDVIQLLGQHPEAKCVCKAGCDGCTCLTKLTPIRHIDAPDRNSGFNFAMRADYPGWTVSNTNNNLMGTIIVSTYDAHVCDPFVGNIPGPSRTRLTGVHCRHGAQLGMGYVPGQNETAPPGLPEIHWVQTIAMTQRGCGLPTLYEDQIDARSSIKPYYSWPINNYFDAPESGCALFVPATQQWISNCTRPGSGCPEPCTWEWDFRTYVAYGTPGGSGTGTMMPFDGIAWGFKATCTPGANPIGGLIGGTTRCASLHFNPAAGTLDVSDTVIDTLGQNGSRATDPAFADDVLMGATISITGLTYDDNYDGLHVFNGGTYRVQKNGLTYVEAELPVLLVDDDASALYGENLYAQLTDLVFSHTDQSPWLAAYAQYYQDYPEQVPEFRGLTAAPVGADLAAMNEFTVDSTSLMAFCPEPATLALLALGGLAVIRRRWN